MAGHAEPVTFRYRTTHVLRREDGQWRVVLPERGRVATVRRDASTAAVVDGVRLREALAALSPSRAQVVPEAGGWSVFIPGLPIAADGSTFDEAIEEMVEALREYADDWQQRLLDAPNHRANWGLVQLIVLSDDEQLRDWLVADTPR